MKMSRWKGESRRRSTKTIELTVIVRRAASET
jgi:hypothetical protein